MKTIYYCEKCGKLVTKKFGSGRFCSRSCANSRVHSEECKERISKSVKNNFKNMDYFSKNNLIKKRSQENHIKKFNIYYKNPNFCKECGKIIDYNNRHKKFCSDKCKIKNVGGFKRSKIFSYKGIKLQSSYEFLVAKDLDKNKIKWQRPKNFFYKTDKLRKYTPDFYLPDFEVYLDPKNDFLMNKINPYTKINDLQKIKIVEKQNNIIIIPLSKEQLKWEIIEKLIYKRKMERWVSG